MVRGGIVAYERCVKIRLQDVRVDQPLGRVGSCRADGSRRVTTFDADIGIASTGLPDPIHLPCPVAMRT